MIGADLGQVAIFSPACATPPLPGDPGPRGARRLPGDDLRACQGDRGAGAGRRRRAAARQQPHRGRLQSLRRARAADRRPALRRRRRGSCAALQRRDLPRLGVADPVLGPLPPADREEGRERESVLASTRTGLRHAFANPVTRVVTLALLFMFAFVAIDNVALVFLVRDTLSGGSAAYGIVSAIFGVGMLLGLVGVMRRTRTPPTVLYLLALGLSSVGTLATGVAPGITLVALAQLASGGGNGIEIVASETIFQQHVPRHLLGRVYGLTATAVAVGSGSRWPSVASSSTPPLPASPSSSPAPAASWSPPSPPRPCCARDDREMNDLTQRLLTAEEAAAMEARGGTEAAVLLPLYGWPEEPGLIFTERRADMRRHAGEISFPGGRRDEIDADLATTALREAAGGDRPRAGAGRAGRGAASGLDLRHRLLRPPLRRPRRPPGRAGPGAQPDRGRDRPHLLARAAARELRDAPPGPPRRPHPHPHLRGRRAADLGSDRADPRRPTASASTSRLAVRAAGRCGCTASAPPSRRGRSPSPRRWRPSRR